ncbi:HTH-type transcriptional activator RhaR [Achromobacter piechaudii]|uniref:HTH-type transcriptional activator RhaR n=1 Tax=Achromobacter piechaudii TaxID=72556 RepID=A0A6S7CWQ9_9BURK|nr:HTH-type transcriptional activator RhaR [Achromobacter piechaudii]CAB3865803.1 HTH-type transcriptional activator RhaR [Achromobacter piechaudii]CAB3869987.1 HTH-type transcriptional activator RhaR [Achromobacter piechaudii]CAB3948117.1 HTH-type transcriptional activator RhaR [Achromobacter piechaudii]
MPARQRLVTESAPGPESAHLSAGAPARATDALGCSATKLVTSQYFEGGGLTFYRKSTDNERFGNVETPASDRGYLVGVAMQGGHRRRILQGNHATTHDFDKGSVYIRDFTDDYRADLQGGFDFVLIELPRAFIERVNDEKGGPRVSSLLPRTGEGDPVLANLSQVLANVLAQPAPSNNLFVQHLSLAIGAHLLSNYGAGATSGWADSGGARVLSRKLEARAKDMLMSTLREDLSIADIADACNLSRSYFIKAFRQTVGTTPHRWLLEQRVQKAQELLRVPGQSITDIALLCGFADQAHLTRVFTSVVGVSPGAWRKVNG